MHPSPSDHRTSDQGSLTASLLAGLLLLTVPLVGCAEDGGPSSSAGGEGMTAADGLEDAEAVAADWSQEATFIGAGTLETSREEPEDWASQAPEFQPDENIGNGLAHQWSYTFENADGERINVYVTDEGETYQESSDQADFFMNAEVADWSVDSQEAVETARDEVDDFDAVIGTDGAEVGYVIAGGEDGDTAWILDAQADDEQVTVSVDAETGEVQRMGQS